VPSLEVSSTDLRNRVRDGRPLDYLVTHEVVDCIEARRLYRGVP
jgi:nicotinate-nucleotide adenylyltransferase